MDLSDFYLIITILFFGAIIFFAFKKVDFIDRLEAVFLSISGFWIYAILCGGYMLDYCIGDVIWMIIAMMMLIIMVYLFIRKCKYFKRWEIVVFYLVEFTISCLAISDVSERVTKYIS